MTRSRTFMSIFVSQIRHDKASKSNSKNSMLFIHAKYVLVAYYFVSTDYKTFVLNKCCDGLTA